MKVQSEILLPVTKVFVSISELNLSSNRISTLPDEIAECAQLEKVDISQVCNGQFAISKFCTVFITLDFSF